MQVRYEVFHYDGSKVVRFYAGVLRFEIRGHDHDGSPAYATLGRGDV